MKNLLPHIVMIFGLLLTGCTADDTLTEEHRGVEASDPVGQPVLFTSGNIAEVRTRSDAPGSKEPYYMGMNSTSGVPYMALDGRFVCTMYYHPSSGATDSSPFDVRLPDDGGTMTTAWLKVNDNIGSSVYRQKHFPDETTLTIGEYSFDKNATIFYWQNRLTHAFLALADYHKLNTNDGATTAQGKLKMFPYGDYVVSSTEEEVQVDDGNGGTTTQTSTVVTVDPTVNVYDLTRGSRTLFSEQPDPIRALTIMKPAGATQEANRVRLYFKHQFSQIQVNLKGADDESASITTDQIEKVELLGVSTEGYVNNVLNADGTIGNMLNSDKEIVSVLGKEVNLDDYTDEELAVNKWGTSFEMFDMATGTDTDEDGHDDAYATGYLKSFNAIAFGKLWGIRVTWREETGNIRHVATFEVPLTNETETSSPAGGSSAGTPTDPSDAKPVVYLRNLQSGMKYIYNLALRRGTLAVIRTQVIPWKQKEELVYGTDGTITN